MACEWSAGQDVERGNFFSSFSGYWKWKKWGGSNCYWTIYLKNRRNFPKIYNSFCRNMEWLVLIMVIAMGQPQTLTHSGKPNLGDFSNGAQKLWLDPVHSGQQRINGNCRMDWLCYCHMVEGQGAEHSSAVWSGIAMCARDYMFIAACVHTSANMFPFVKEQWKWTIRKAT